MYITIACTTWRPIFIVLQIQTLDTKYGTPSTLCMNCGANGINPIISEVIDALYICWIHIYESLRKNIYI